MAENFQETNLLDQNSNYTFQNRNPGRIKEAVCIDAFRIYDSCADKDCLSNLRVNFTESGQHMIDQACSVRLKDVNVITTYVNLEPVPFNKGFYSVDMTFFFEVNLELFLSPSSSPVNVSGLSIFDKKVVLFGSEGSVKVFNSTANTNNLEYINAASKNLPKATVQVAKPIGLDAKLRTCNQQNSENVYPIPEWINQRYGGEILTQNLGNTVLVTIGIFTVVQIERNVQILVPTYDFTLPEKECVTTTDDPCELFNKLDFPTEEFFPPRVTDLNSDTRENFN